MPRGGRRVGAGRKAGGASKLSRMEANRAAVEITKSPLRFLLEIVADETQPLNTRIQCAIAIMPFRHPRLCSLPVHAGFSALLDAERGLVDVTPVPSAQSVTINIVGVPSGEFLEAGTAQLTCEAVVPEPDAPSEPAPSSVTDVDVSETA